MALRGFGTEFHTSTISVGGTDQRTFGQDTDSEYDVSISTSGSTNPSYIVVEESFDGNRIGDGQNKTFYPEFSFTTGSGIQSRVTWRKTNSESYDYYPRIDINGTEYHSSKEFSTWTVSTGWQDEQPNKFTLELDGSSQDSVEGSEMECAFEARVSPSVVTDYTVDGVSKTQ